MVVEFGGVGFSPLSFSPLGDRFGLGRCCVMVHPPLCISHRVGYGDVVPQTTAGRLTAVILIAASMFASFFFSFFFFFFFFFFFSNFGTVNFVRSVFDCNHQREIRGYFRPSFPVLAPALHLFTSLSDPRCTRILTQTISSLSLSLLSPFFFLFPF